MFAHNLFDRLIANRENIEPVKHCPQPILLTHMVGTRTGTFFAAERCHIRIKQTAKILPAGRRLITSDT